MQLPRFFPSCLPCWLQPYVWAACELPAVFRGEAGRFLIDLSSLTFLSERFRAKGRNPYAPAFALPRNCGRAPASGRYDGSPLEIQESRSIPYSNLPGIGSSAWVRLA